MTKTEKALLLRRQNQLNRHRGAQFEDLIRAACDYYRGRGVADIEKTPEEMKPIKNMGKGHFVAVYVKKAQADFKGFLRGGLAVNFEAKHTDTPRMEQDRVTPEQADRLERALQVWSRRLRGLLLLWAGLLPGPLGSLAKHESPVWAQIHNHPGGRTLSDHLRGARGPAVSGRTGGKEKWSSERRSRRR